ncbi:cation efflux family-domain-containing protein [Abortiporus biennis]|nr:cation efflux family-domain-containing protein [Abortiporus biennis]
MDARTRSKVPLLEKSHQHLLPHVWTDAASTVGLFAGAHYLSSGGVNIHATLLVALLFSSIGHAIQHGLSLQRFKAMTSADLVPMALSSILLYSRNICLLLALSMLPISIRLVLIFHFSDALITEIFQPASIYRAVACICAMLFSFMLDIFTIPNDQTTLFGYALVAAAIILDFSLNRLRHVITPRVGEDVSKTVILVSANILAIAVQGLGIFPIKDEGSTFSLHLVALFPAFILSTPLSSFSPLKPRTQSVFMSSFALIVLISSMLSVRRDGVMSFLRDVPVIAFVYYGIFPIYQTNNIGRAFYTSMWSIAQRYIRSILENPESRKIFYFLVLNMCYMLVQMVYGIWTNSLGLISDAIHMAFDCMAIGIGLIASVMARWEPNEKFTYGYGRIETLSGFSNGIFLILISIFIVFEAIERLLNPPEMNTAQLLLVSSLGLAVNLFGMFAMGGHHHGGHSHSHSHSHGHSHDSDHDHDHSAILDHSHSNTESHHDHEQLYPEHHNHSHDSGTLTSQLPFKNPQIANLLAEDQIPESPITPLYKFVHDTHLEHHHGVINDSNHEHEGHSHNMRGVFLHVLADTMGSVGVIISTILIQLYGWTGFDPIASLFIAILIAASVMPLVIDTGKVLLLDLSDYKGDIQVANSELSNLQDVDVFTSHLWLKGDNAITGSIELKLKNNHIDSSSLTSSKKLTSILYHTEELFSDKVRKIDHLNVCIDC